VLDVSPSPIVSPHSFQVTLTGWYRIGQCAREAVVVLSGTPESVLGILRSAHSSAPDPRLQAVLEEFRKHWISLGRRRYPQLQDDLEDAVQTALMKLLSSDKLDTLREAERLEAWARSLFVHTVLDLARDSRRHSRRRSYVGTPEDDPEHALRDSLPDEADTPEDLASHRERLAIVARAASRLEVARLKFVEDLPEKEIAQRQGLTRDSVAGQLKRIRKSLRQAFEDPE
jgi:RNA polymerase sigma factor (sigma-70 family)